MEVITTLNNDFISLKELKEELTETTTDVLLWVEDGKIRVMKDNSLNNNYVWVSLHFSRDLDNNCILLENNDLENLIKMIEEEIKKGSKFFWFKSEREAYQWICDNWPKWIKLSF